MRKSLAIGMAIIGFSVTALAGNTRTPAAAGKSTPNPQIVMTKAAHQYIATNADLGGEVKSPCPIEMKGDASTVTCSGVYRILGPGGGGDFPVKFSCVGVFTQGENGAFYYTKVDCEDQK